ncbi:hypothetical protein ACFWFQ_20625 [Nocardia salmonicida]|uniref:TRAFAC clade GTPase domain-containing protein n=1 Tax=Nocardia salmonicida TaxID=53431 RepID=UPI00365BA028
MADTKLAEFKRMATPELRAPVFTADGRNSHATCPHCDRKSGQRVCPHCHSQLPGRYVDTPARIVALIGAKESGKSTYIATLIHELKNRVGSEFGFSLEEGGDTTRDRYRNQFFNPLFGERTMVNVTQSAGIVLNHPLIYTIAAGRERQRWGRNPALTMVLYDNAGEDFLSEEAVARNLAYIAAADAVIFLVDPGTLRDEGGIDVITRITAHLRAHHDVQGGKPLPVPMAVALSKVDTLDSDLPRNSQLRRPRPPTGTLDLADRTAVHEEIRALLDLWQSRQLDLFISHNYRKYGLFGLSALGNAPVDQMVNPVGVQPHRVEDPVLWLLHEFGMLSATKG